MASDRRLTGADVMTVFLLLDGEGAEITAEVVELRLAMILHGDDPADVGKAEAILTGPGPVYLEYVAPVLLQQRPGPEVSDAPDGVSRVIHLTHPLDDLPTVTVSPLQGRHWRLALSEFSTIARICAMTGLSREQVRHLDFADLNGIETACRPFVGSILETLISGGLLSPS